MATPFITPIKNQGGTFYTFPSANEDYNFTISSPNKEFKYSKFVLLDLPPIQDPSTGRNTTGVENIPSSYLQGDTSDYNVAFAESFQNYCLNLETLLIAQDAYDSQKSKTVSEKVFWKWVKEPLNINIKNSNVVASPHLLPPGHGRLLPSALRRSALLPRDHRAAPPLPVHHHPRQPPACRERRGHFERR